MEIIFEIIFDVVLEGLAEIAKSKKISKFIRYPLIFLYISALAAIVGLLLWCGIRLVLDALLWAGILVILLSAALLTAIVGAYIYKFKKRR